MSRIGPRDSAPERAVRAAAHALGFRFRLHRKDLPGTPDLVFPRLGIVILVHGCYWHRRRSCSRTTTPKTRTTYWQQKFRANVDRDERVTGALEASGWRVIVIWECETLDRAALDCRLRAELAR